VLDLEFATECAGSRFQVETVPGAGAVVLMGRIPFTNFGCTGLIFVATTILKGKLTTMGLVSLDLGIEAVRGVKGLLKA
jgi:hypothetical protein